jgi:hypothetical protein
VDLPSLEPIRLQLLFHSCLQGVGIDRSTEIDQQVPSEQQSVHISIEKPL